MIVKIDNEQRARDQFAQLFAKPQSKPATVTATTQPARRVVKVARVK